MALARPVHYLVRHLAPAVEPGVCYGRSDLPVSAEAIKAALPALRACLPPGTPVYSSPLRRCADLARALAGPAVILDERLAELNFGSWELRRWSDIGRAEIDAWALDVANYRLGGAESVADMAQRVAAFYADLPPEPAVIICHAGTIRLLLASAQGLGPQAMAHAAAAKPNPIAYGEIVLMHGV
jgi:alpha-ribazole phosphatase